MAKRIRPSARTTKQTPPSSTAIVRDALKHGKSRAAAVAAMRRTKLSAGTGRPGANGVLVAEGDSWFDYPFNDVLGLLEDQHNFRVESVAHHGDSVEEMAYDTSQLTALARKMEHLQNDGRVPRAILISGGGNDIAGDTFGVLLNHHSSSLTPLNGRILEGVINERLRFAMASLIGGVTELSKRYFNRVTPVIMHGYGYPVPDGRGYLGGFWKLPGPWLEPGFRQKGYADLKQTTRLMADLIDLFNDMLASLPNQPGLGHVRYIDLRTLLSNTLEGRAYRQSWANELHPSKKGFEAVAAEFSKVILAL
jgi:lysophospholipase L1-like esterase